MKVAPLLVAAALICALSAGSAAAHHTGSAVDYSKQIRLQGTVKQWQFTNPHSWLDVVVSYPDGQTEQWAFETGSINSLIRRGWASKSLVVGEKVTVVAYPLKSGNVGGALAQVIKADGKVVGQALGNQAAGS